MAPPHDASTRLIQVLRIYCQDLGTRSMADLRASLTRGRYPWLRHELHAAITRQAFTPAAWLALTGTRPRLGEAEHAAMHRQQHHVWRALFGEPSPGTAAEVVPHRAPCHPAMKRGGP